jgi:hypothetical protein
MIHFFGTKYAHLFNQKLISKVLEKIGFKVNTNSLNFVHSLKNFTKVPISQNWGKKQILDRIAFFKFSLPKQNYFYSQLCSSPILASTNGKGLNGGGRGGGGVYNS